VIPTLAGPELAATTAQAMQARVPVMEMGR